MTTNELNREIAKASIEFARLNRCHWRKRRNAGLVSTIEYHSVPPATEKRIVDLALRIARLRRFEAHLRVKEQL